MATVFSIKYNTAFGPKYVKLPGVKESLYHPNLPTFRRMDMDTAAHKLPDEHCRTTTPCSKDDFRRGAVTFLIKPFNYKMEMSNKGKYSRHMNLYSFTSNVKDTDSEQDFGENLKKYQDLSEEAERYRPHEASRTGNTWKFMLQQEPYIDHIGQRPIPATTFSRYRTLSSSHGGQVSTNAWKP